MTTIHSHPSLEELLAVAEGRAVPDRPALLDHVATCEGCEAVLVALAPRMLDPTKVDTTKVDTTKLEATKLEATTLAAGARPAARGPLAARSVGAWLAAAASVAVIIMAVAGSRPASATNAVGTLEFIPAHPRPGDSVRVRFRGGLLANRTRLRLRTEIRGETGDYPEWIQPKRVASMLSRLGDGSFGGRFVFPDSARYAVFVVEDEPGETVDANAGRLWELLAYDSARVRPLPSAFEQKTHLFYERDRAVARRTARAMLAAYPELPRARDLAFFYERELVGAAGADSLRRSERDRFVWMDSTWRARTTVSAQDLASMGNYADAMIDSVRAAYWDARLQREHPEHPKAAAHRIFAAIDSAREPLARLAKLEHLWTNDSAAREGAALQGFLIARGLPHDSLLVRWGERLRQFGPPNYLESPVGYAYVERPALAERGAAIMRRQLARFGAISDTTRTIGRSVAQMRAPHGQGYASRLLSLGKALQMLGRTAAALDTLEVAAHQSWRSDVYLELSAARLAVADTVGAARDAAFASVDPSLPAPSLARVQQQFAAYRTREVWTRWRDSATRTMHAQLKESGVRRTLPGRVRLVDASGRERSFEELVGGRPTVFAFWSRWCGGSLAELPDLQRTSADLARLGVRLVAVTADPIDDELRAWLREKGYTFPIYQDRRGEAGAAFQPFGTPDHILVDGEGFVRFERLRARELPAYAALLER